MPTNKAVTYLHDAEYQLLNKLAGLSGMACWFVLKPHSNGMYTVYDAEDNCEYTLKKGVSMLFEGITNLDDYGCTNEEKEAYTALCTRLGI